MVSIVLDSAENFASLSAWGKVASAFAIASLALVPPNQRTELLRKTMTPLFEGPIAHVMDNMCLGRLCFMSLAL